MIFCGWLKNDSLMDKWNPLKPSFTAKALYYLKPKPHEYIWKINFPSAVNNPCPEIYLHQGHFSETLAFNLKYFLASEMVWWRQSKQELYPDSWWLLRIAHSIDTDSTHKGQPVESL